MREHGFSREDDVRMERELHIAYASDHNYMLYCCVSIYSLMAHLPSDRQVKLHLLIDESFCEEDAALLRVITNRYSNLSILKHCIREDTLEELNFAGTTWSKAMCYRMMLPGLLVDVDYCLYMDSDTLVTGDLLPLWEIDMTGQYLAGVFQDIAVVRNETVRDQMPGLESYVNTGVLFMNLALMREQNLQKEFLARISDQYMLMDQDVLNICCYGHILILDSAYNAVPGVYAEHPRILHFPFRDYLRPWKNKRARGAFEWWQVAWEFRDVLDIRARFSDADWYEKGSIAFALRRCADYSTIYVLGSGEDAERLYRSLKHGKCKGLRLQMDEDTQIPYTDDTFVILCSRKKNLPAISAFNDRAGASTQILKFDRRPLSFLALMPEDCRKEVYGEMIMWEFAADAKGQVLPHALAEMAAARFPDRTALEEITETGSSVLSFRELNRGANRIAHLLLKRGAHPGDQVCLELPSYGYSTAMLTELIGIWKSGCIAVLMDHDSFRRNYDSFCMSIPETPLFPDEVRLNGQCRWMLGEHDLHRDETLPVLSPLMDPHPDLGALCTENVFLTNRMLMEHVDRERKRLGWHDTDRLLLSGQPDMQGLLEWLCALYDGCTTVLYSDEHNQENLLFSKTTENCTILKTGYRELERILQQTEKMTDEQARCCLPSARVMIVTDTDRKALEEWRYRFPRIPVNGIGFNGMFRHKCEWYL